MKLDVYDTYVHTDEDALVHFVVLVPQGMGKHATLFVKQWLKEVGISYRSLKQENCRFCHSELATPEIEHYIKQHGYFILQLEGYPTPV